MIKPKVGICTCIMKGYNLGEEDSVGYQEELKKSVINLGFDPVVSEEFISSAEIAKKVAALFKEQKVDVFILNIGT
ncbi:MAG: hypothetical protein FJW66_01325, partial [Actinobacteria bacterium]|nr:hypothetical protein [Actinomycetota bacterium]